jgi:hypothetical protein
MSKELDNIIPIFIFPPEHIDPKKNKYFSHNLVQFMCESLIELDKNYSKKMIIYNFLKVITWKY